MTIRFDRLLKHWYPQRDQQEWVLATIISTERSTYRKAGAMMLFNGLGQSYGMLSGGCLEGDLLQQARKVLLSGKSQIAQYDLRDDGDSQWQRGIGCGGAVNIMLQSIHHNNNYLGLTELYEALESDNPSVYLQGIDSEGVSNNAWQVQACDGSEPIIFPGLCQNKSISVQRDESQWLATLIEPAPRLAIFGGGLDAIPLAEIAHTLGWQVSVVDRRVGYAKLIDFPHATIVRDAPCESSTLSLSPDAIVIMTHSIERDAEALIFAQRSKARFVGMLGPQHRRERVEKHAGLNANDFKQHYCGPVGFDIGAELPETIALSILAQCHQYVEGKSMRQQVAVKEAIN